MISKAYISSRLARLPVLEKELSDPAVSADRQRFRRLVREHAQCKRLQERAQRYFRIADEIAGHRALLQLPEDEELKALARAELEPLDEQLVGAERELMLALLPPDPRGARNAIMEIRAGTGGDEAGLFAGDLFRMYSRFAESRGWKVSVIDLSPGEIGGYKEIVFSVGDGAVFETLQYESGVHRVQRVPETESSGRIHTSAATVAVFPEAEPEDDVSIRPEEIRIDIFRSSGPGGQSVNTTDSAVRVTHLETGIVVQCQDEKSQHRNKERALSVLRARLLDHRRREEEQRRGQARRSQIGSGDRSERARTYNFPQNRVTDHRVDGLTLYSLDRIMEGELDELIAALRDHDVQLRLAAELKTAGFARESAQDPGTSD